MSALAQILGDTFSPREPGGPARLAALLCFLLALIGAGVVLLQPQAAHWAGVALLGTIGAAAVGLLILVWPRPPGGLGDGRRFALAPTLFHSACADSPRGGVEVDFEIALPLHSGVR